MKLPLGILLLATALIATQSAQAKKYKFSMDVEIQTEEEGFAVFAWTDDYSPIYKSMYLGKTPLDKTTISQGLGLFAVRPKVLNILAYKPGFAVFYKKLEFENKGEKSVSIALDELQNNLVSRGNFKIMAVGRTSDEMIEIFGRPNSTGSGYWYYRGFVVDTVAQKVDVLTQIKMTHDGVVSYVNF